MSYWNAFAKKFPSRSLLRIDGGSIFMRGTAAEAVVNRYMLEGTQLSQLDALNMTSWDVPVWQEMGDMAAAGLIPAGFLKLPLICGNITTKLPNFPAFQRFIIKELQVDPKAGRPLRVGITGVIADPEERISRKDFEIQKPDDAARKLVADMNGKADYIILVTDMGLGQAISLAFGVPGIHMIVVVHDYAAPTEAQQVGESLVLGPVNEGRMLSEVRLNVRSGAQRVEIESHLVSLDRTVPDDPKMAEMAKKAQSEVDKIQK
jgi:2',3'-cyclic-nucleotide 2'-phosphodiesterase (5'-nucleotidase family)